jgi:CheY-like chemotaxis protein
MKRLKILIVDDIFTNRLLLEELLKTLGHESAQAENGMEAINLLQADHFDLVLMDIEMPVMNGLETSEYIRNNFPTPKNGIKIIALTAHNPSLFFSDFSDAGFDAILTKPYSLIKLTDLINKLS